MNGQRPNSTSIKSNRKVVLPVLVGLGLLGAAGVAEIRTPPNPVTVAPIVVPAPISLPHPPVYAPAAAAATPVVPKTADIPPAFPLATEMRQGFRLAYYVAEDIPIELGGKVETGDHITFSTTVPDDVRSGLDVGHKPIRTIATAFVKIERSGTTTLAAQIKLKSNWSLGTAELKVDGVTVATAEARDGNTASAIGAQALAAGWHKIDLAVAIRTTLTGEPTPTGEVDLKIKLPGGQLQDLAGFLPKDS